MEAYGLILLVLNCLGRYKLFEKAGIEGWKAIIPYYNNYIYCKICGCVRLFFVDLVLSISMLGIGIKLIFDFFKIVAYGSYGYGNLEVMDLYANKAIDTFGIMIFLLIIIAIALFAIKLYVNLKFVTFYTDELVFKILFGLGCVPILYILLVIGRCILGFDDKYTYKGLE